MPDQSPALDDRGSSSAPLTMGKPDSGSTRSPPRRAAAGNDLAEMADEGARRGRGRDRTQLDRRFGPDAPRAGLCRRARPARRSAMPRMAGWSATPSRPMARPPRRLGLASAPAVAEAMAVARDLTARRRAPALALHFRQVTTAARASTLVRDAKKRGMPVTCGITPAHLLLSDIAVADFRTFARSRRRCAARPTARPPRGRGRRHHRPDLLGP